MTGSDSTFEKKRLDECYKEFKKNQIIIETSPPEEFSHMRFQGAVWNSKTWHVNNANVETTTRKYRWLPSEIIIRLAYYKKFLDKIKWKTRGKILVH